MDVLPFSLGISPENGSPGAVPGRGFLSADVLHQHVPPNVTVALSRQEFESSTAPADIIYQRTLYLLDAEEGLSKEEIEWIDSDPAFEEAIRAAYRDAHAKLKPKILGKEKEEVKVTVSYELPNEKRGFLGRRKN
jgi:hypothetical protein